LERGRIMIGSMIITGGILCAGVSTYNYLAAAREQPRFQITSIWENLRDRIFYAEQPRENSEEKINNGKTVVIEYEIEQQKELERNLTLAGTALGLSTLGIFVFPPLHWASMPVLIYMGVPSAQGAYDDLYQSRHLGRSLIETGVLAVFLAQNAYLTGSIGFFGYYLARFLKMNMSNKLELALPQITVWRNGTQMKLSVDEIQEKDIFQVNSGEQVYVDGIVIDGIALGDLQWATGEQSPVTKKAGSKIPMSTVISVGMLWIEYQGT